MILPDRDILQLLPTLIPDPAHRRMDHINPASLDVCLGASAIREGYTLCEIDDNFIVEPGEFVLVSTLERIAVPNHLAADIRLKSSMARRGFNHNLAVWVDPGWDGHLTMEISNVTRATPLFLTPGMRFAQLIIHQLTAPAMRPYRGRYQGAMTVEAEKA